MGDAKSLADTKGNCKYDVGSPLNIVVSYFEGEEAPIGEILQKLWEWKAVNIIEAGSSSDHNSAEDEGFQF